MKCQDRWQSRGEALHVLTRLHLGLRICVDQWWAFLDGDGVLWRRAQTLGSGHKDSQVYYLLEDEVLPLEIAASCARERIRITKMLERWADLPYARKQCLTFALANEADKRDVVRVDDELVLSPVDGSKRRGRSVYFSNLQGNQVKMPGIHSTSFIWYRTIIVGLPISCRYAV